MRRFAALLPVLWCGLALPASAAWVLVDDFSGSSPGPLTGQSSALGTTWSAPGVYSVIADPTNPGNQVLQANMGANSGNRWAFLPLGTQEIADGTSGTLFFRYRREGAVDANIGLTDVNSPGGFGDYRVQLNTQTDDPSDFQLRNGGSFNTLDSPSFDDGTWYHVWMTADNAADTFHVHILDAGTGAGQAFQLAAPPASFSGANDTFDFREGVNNAIDRFFLAVNSPNGNRYFIDDIYIDNTGFNLTNPVIPEPGRALMLGLGAALLMLRRSRKPRA